MKWFKYSLILAGFLLFTLLIWHFELITYGLRQARGQYSIISGAIDMDELLEREDLADTLREDLLLIKEVKQFAYDALGLDRSDIYETVNIDTTGHTMYVVTAADKFQMRPYLWDFPIAGRVPYKGFFDLEHALKERDRLLLLNLDVGIRTAGGWSTLGWVENPLLVKNLDDTKGQIVNLVLHEMAHETIYLADSTALNENLATFIGDAGTMAFLENIYPDEVESYLDRESDSKKYADHFISGARALDSLYGSFTNSLPDSAKSQLKDELISGIMDELDTVSFSNKERYTRIFRDRKPNNTYFLSFTRYRSDQSHLYRELEMEYDGDLREFIRVLIGRYR